jgi:trk system potassium uptake protein TrkA
MKIIIAGDNLTAYSIASALAQEQHDITLIGNNQDRLKTIEESIDIQTVLGAYTAIDTLEVAECDHADILIAATEVPEIDILISLLASNFYQIPLTISILQAALYEHRQHLLPDLDGATRHLWINPAQLTATSIIDLLSHPNCKDITTIHKDYRVVRYQITDLEALPEQRIAGLREQLPDTATLIAIIRKGKALDLSHNSILMIKDHVIVACHQSDANSIIDTLNKPRKVESIIMAGISETSQCLVEKLPAHIQIKIIEDDLEKATSFAKNIDNITVLHGDINDTDLLITEKIDNTDAFLTLSKDDEDNLVAALQAKRHHVPWIASQVHREEIAPIINEQDILSIEPQQMLTNFIFQTIHNDLITERHTLRDQMGEILCIRMLAHQHMIPLNSLNLPVNAKVFYLFRDNQVIPQQPTLKIKTDDVLAVYLPRKEDIAEITQHLQSSAPSFFDFLKIKT